MALARPRWQEASSDASAERRRRRVPLTVVWLAALGLLTALPILLAGIRTPAGSVFVGYVVIARDAEVYQALWRAGWQGAWLFHSPYATESLPGILLYPWYLWPAHLVGWAAGPWLYHLSRLAAGAALLSSVWWLVAELFRPRLLRRWAFALCVLGGGIGALLPRELRIGPLVTHATEMTSPGSTVADLVSMAPHLPWALALMCWTMVVALRLRHRVSRGLIASGLAAIVGLQLIYPQLALLAAAAMLGWAIARRQWPAAWFSLATAAVQLPYLAYLLWIWRTAPAALRVIRPALDVGDPFGFLVLSHLTASGLIIIAIWQRRLRGDLLLPALWIVGMTIFMFAPGISGVLGRSFMAGSVPFGLCAAPGLLVLARAVRSIAWRRRLLVITLAASSFYGVFSLAQPYWIAAFRLDPRAEYESQAEAALLSRLAPHASARDVVLTTYLDGIFVPAQTDARAFDGHPEMTIDAGRKADEALAFFTRWSTGQRAAFLQANRIDYVLATDAGVVDWLRTDTGLRLVDREDDAALFTVQP